MPSVKEPVSGLPLLVHQLRRGGAAWLLDRVRREWEMPTTGPGRRLYRAVHGLKFWQQKAFQPPDGQQDTLYAFYDLAVAPITFDFLWFLAGAEIARKNLALSGVHIVIVPGRDDGLRRERSDYDRVIGHAERQARIGKILVPTCALLPSVTGVTLASSREEAAAFLSRAGKQVFPSGYETGAPLYPGGLRCIAGASANGAEIAVLRSTSADLEEVDSWLAAHQCHGQIIVITLRAYRYMEARNSNLEAWVAFANGLDRARFSPVFVPDADQVLTGMPAALSGLCVFAEAAINVRLRSALYERAFLNLGVNSGPMGLCWLNARTRYLTFKLLTPSVPQATPEYIASLGFELGKSLPFAMPGQKFVWEDDGLPVIEREFSKMVGLIDAASDQSPATYER